MLDYYQWNEEIFKYFFNEENANKNVLFCVDEEVIAEIGSKYGMSKESSLKNFCELVSKRILTQKDNGEYRIKLSDFIVRLNNNVPTQTSIIAFYILAASKMGEDKITGFSNISDRNYYTKLAQLSKNIGYKNIYKGHSVNDRDYYFEMFNHFEDFVNRNSDLYGKIRFIGLFERKDRTRKDWVGIPIFQSMLSKLDKAYLANYFSSIYNKNTVISLNRLKNSSVFSKLSRVFQVVSNKEEYRNLLEEHLNNLYEDWLQAPCTYEINERNRKINRKIELKWAIMLYLYQKEYDDYNFYEIFKNNSNEKILDIGNKSYEKYNSNDYYFREIEKKDICISSRQYPNTINLLLKLHDIRNGKFILFKKSEEFDGFYIETERASVGDTISIVAEWSFFERNAEEITRITRKNCNTSNIKNIPFTTKRIIENIQVFETSSLLNIENNERCKFTKGLKQGNTRKYLKGAEPIVVFPEERNQNNVYSIDNDTVNLNHNIIDLRKYNLPIGEHKIKYSNKEDKIIIVDEIECNKSEYDGIYNYIEGCSIKKITNFDEQIKNLINGCFIENSAFLQDNKTEINSQKRNYVEFIIKAIKKKQKNSKYSKKRIKDNIELRYLKELEDK